MLQLAFLHVIQASVVCRTNFCSARKVYDKISSHLSDTNKCSRAHKMDDVVLLLFHFTVCFQDQEQN